MTKCNFCAEEATKETMLYTSDGNSFKTPVYLKHFLESEYGIVTVECESCKQPTLLNDDSYYHMKQIFCAHCRHLMENEEWIERIKGVTSKKDD